MIMKYGKVVITEGNINITGFEFDATSEKSIPLDALMHEAAEWAIERLEKVPKA